MGATEAVPGVPAELGSLRAALRSQGQEAPGYAVTSQPTQMSVSRQGWQGVLQAQEDLAYLVVQS